jgi:DNA (cytosine-5)-methyltransferase 1
MTPSGTSPTTVGIPCTTTVRALELFCGIGGFAAAAAGSNLRVVGALDQDPMALATYRLNFPHHGARRVDLERVGGWELTGGIDFWWLSPPCQPYCERGARRDLIDPRARSLVRIMEILASLADDRLPRHLTLENVAGFQDSQAHTRLREILVQRGYALQELLFCPTQLGVPSRRPRFYLAASQEPLSPPAPVRPLPRRPFTDYLDRRLDSEVPAALAVPTETVARFGSGFRILHPDDGDAYTTCFTSGYGRSLMAAGSYIQCPAAVRRFTPEEILRLLHFPSSFVFPEGLSLRQRWHLVGNSLSVVAVRRILALFPAIVPSGDAAEGGASSRAAGS